MVRNQDRYMSEKLVLLLVIIWSLHLYFAYRYKNGTHMCSIKGSRIKDLYLIIIILYYVLQIVGFLAEIK